MGENQGRDTKRQKISEEEEKEFQNKEEEKEEPALLMDEISKPIILV